LGEKRSTYTEKKTLRTAEHHNISLGFAGSGKKGCPESEGKGQAQREKKKKKEKKQRGGIGSHAQV